MASTPGDIPTNARRPMFALFAANTISQLGNTFTMLAIPWFVLATTGSASKTGITVAVGAVPSILVGIFGGAIVDRIGYKRASIISDVLSGLSVLLIPLLHQTIGLTFWQLLVLVFLGAFFDGPGTTARRALFPELVHWAGGSLERANAGYNTTGRIASLLGQPVAGLLIAALGPSNLLWVDAVTFGVSSVITLILIPNIPRERPVAMLGGFRGYLRDVRSGFQFLLAKRLLLWMIVAFSVGGLVAEPLYGVILPVYANEVFGTAAQLGFIFAALGAGSILGNIVYVRIAAQFSRSAILLGGFGIRAAAFAIMLTMPPWWMIAAAIFVGAVAFEPINPMTMSLMQEQVPSGMRGRVFGAQTAIGASAFPVGLVAYGFLMSHLGLQQTLVLFVALNALLPIVMVFLPALRRIPRPIP
ncbi:MAG: MFS transporter [Thermomicrobiales bacterium]